jgi:hypothetical protein
MDRTDHLSVMFLYDRFTPPSVIYDNLGWRMLNWIIGKRRCPAKVGTVRLEKVAQSLIKGPILTSEASLCFTVLFIIKNGF